MLGMTKTNELATFKPVNLAAASQKLVGSKMGDTVIERIYLGLLIYIYKIG